MSLTSFLEDCPDVRARLLAHFKKPEFRVEARLLAPPLTDAYSIAGTAFDYLLRFYLQKLNSNSRASAWVAEVACTELRLNGGTLLGKGTTRIIEEAKACHTAFLASRQKRPGRELIQASVRLAYLDAVYRVGIFDEKMFRAIPAALIDDLEAMLELVRAQDFRAKRRCILNPGFGTGSHLVGGADADLLIDDTLIDIKAVKHLVFDRYIFNQLLGYYLLSCIGGVEGCRRPGIRYLAIYYARYGVLHRVRLADFVAPSELPGFLRWFAKRARRYCRIQS